MKTCGCGNRFDAEQWRQLRLVGRQDDGEGGTLELRNCPCGSTICIELHGPAAEPVQQPGASS